MIFNVVWTLLAYRGASINAQELHEPANADKMGFLHGAFASQWFASILPKTNVELWETFFLLLSLRCCSASRCSSPKAHAHLRLDPQRRLPPPGSRGTGAGLLAGHKGRISGDPGDDDVMGVGKIEDFTWKAC